ncbi:MAG: hypothetical protein ACI35W_07710 [Anaeroplasmataceae bacterium]
MTIEEMLQRRFVEYFGFQFQKLFFEIMRNYYGDDFEMPHPYGSEGDYKSDGYLKSKGIFFACYAPENPSEYNDATAMISKLRSDLNGLISKIIDEKKWLYPLNGFTFVLNLKFNNEAPAPLLSEKQNLEANLLKKFNRLIPINIITQYDLKLLFNQLDIAKQKYILEKVYVFDEDMEFDGTIIAKIIEYFSNKEIKPVKPHNLMDMTEKIKFNNLSIERESELIYAAFNISALENYLSSYSPDAQEILQTLVLNLYEDSKKNYPNNSNLQYDFIKEGLFDSKDSYGIKLKIINNTKAIIMSKFFENCSIFESVMKDDN